MSVRAPVGSTNIANQKCAIGRGLATISYPYSNKIIWYYLKLIEQHLDKQGTGTTFRAVSGNVVKKQIFPLAPLPIQRAIVSKIETLFSDLDSGIASLKKAQEQLKIYRQAVLKRAFEGELTKAWRAKAWRARAWRARAEVGTDTGIACNNSVKTQYIASHAPVAPRKTTPLPTAEQLLQQIKEERQNYYNQQIEDWKKAVKDWEKNGKVGKKPSKPTQQKELPEVKESDIEEYGQLPSSWKWVKLGEVCGNVEKVKQKEKIQDEEFIYLDIGGIDNTINKIVSHKKYFWQDAPSRAQQIVKVGDTLFSTVRTYLKNIALVEKDIYDNQICSSGFSVIRAKEDKSIPKYLYYLSLFEEFIQPLNEMQKGSSYPAIRSEDIFNQIIKIPEDTAEQHAIVHEIERRLSVTDELEKIISAEIERSQNLRQSILKKAFEGRLLSEAEIAQCKQEADYEPASKLLARIERSRNEKIQADASARSARGKLATIRQAQGGKKKKK